MALFYTCSSFEPNPTSTSAPGPADETQAAGYWFSVPGRQLVDQVHAIIESRAESGKVLSLSTAFEVMDGLYGGKLGGVELALVENSLPDEVNNALVTPFILLKSRKHD